MKTIPEFKEWALELIRLASTELPEDIRAAIEKGKASEAKGSPADATLQTVLENVALAEKNSTPICQDTGTPIYYVKHPWDYPTAPMIEAIKAATQEATAKYYLRPNAVDSVTGRNSGDNSGDHFPAFYFEQWDREDEIRVDLMLKGGGCENVGIQYSLPDARLGAGRDMDGVRKAIVDSLVQAQGRGCGPAVLGVCIGGDRASGYSIAKKQILRRLDDLNPDALLAELEAEVTEKANRLGIGPMGFGGTSTVLGTKIAKAHRLPASFYVSVVYMCWASRRRAMTIKGGTVSYD